MGVKSTPIIDWLTELGDKTPTPGGGAVSALNGAIAAAQLKMICEYTKDEEINSKASFLADKTKSFLDLAEADSEAFGAVSEAYKNNDSQIIKESLVNAASVSIDIVKNCEELINFCQENLQSFNKRLNADLIVVLANLKAAVESARAMEETNHNSVEGGSSEIASAIQEADELLRKTDQLIVIAKDRQ